MPCYDPETHERPKRLESKVHRLTAMLCRLCGQIETVMPTIIETDAELAEWWINHKTHDQRIAAIREKRKTLGDHFLTPEERGLLRTANDISY